MAKSIIQGIYVSKVQWDGDTLRVYPTLAGRVSVGPFAGYIAWREVTNLAPEADTGGMKDQFFCHWDAVKFRAPRKPSWNLDMSRPDVSYIETIRSYCNPQP